MSDDPSFIFGIAMVDTLVLFDAACNAVVDLRVTCLSDKETLSDADVGTSVRCTRCARGVLWT
eukprot:90147-Pyramimonas_sp.AAC.1